MDHREQESHHAKQPAYRVSRMATGDYHGAHGGKSYSGCSILDPVLKDVYAWL
jgi:hypothetical protein